MIIKNDLFDIAKRAKEIDKSYFIVFNGKSHKFELHGGKEKGYILTLPYDRLDERSISYIRRTRVERINQLIAELDAENMKNERKAMSEAKTQVSEQLREGADMVVFGERKR